MLFKIFWLSVFFCRKKEEIYIMLLKSAIVYTQKCTFLRYIRLTLSTITDTIQVQPYNFNIQLQYLPHSPCLFYSNRREVWLWCICTTAKVVTGSICWTDISSNVQNVIKCFSNWKSLIWITSPWIRKKESGSVTAVQTKNNYRHWALHTECTNTANGTKNCRLKCLRPRFSPIR